MTTREDLRRDGTALRHRLFGPGAMTHFVPNYADLRAELAFGVVWNRPGLALPDTDELRTGPSATPCPDVG